MNLHLKFGRGKLGTTSGFTIIELVLVIALSVLLIGIAMPTGVSFFRSVLVQDQVEEIALAYRGAARDALYGKNDIEHGVMISNNTITVFQGLSYVSRVQSADEIVELISGLSLSGFPQEVVFSKTSGTPSATGTLTVRLYGKTHEIHIDGNSLITIDE